MHPLFSRMTKRYTPPMNERFMNGLACSVMKYVEEYMDAQIRSICVGLPPCVKYLHYERCTADEEFHEITREKNNRRYFNLARSSLYYVKYFFEYTDEMGHKTIIPKYIFLPFVHDGGLIYIGGTEMHIVPVLSDKVFTVNGDSLFVRLAQDKNNFYRMYHTIRVDGKRRSSYVAHAEIYRHSKKDNNVSVREILTKAKTVLPHYLFARYGFYGAFERYLGFRPVIGDHTTITKENYPEKDWVICESTKLQLKKSNLETNYRGSDVRVAIPREKWSHAVECMIVGFYYVVDNFPQRFSAPPDRLEAVINDCSLWMILIGYIRFKGIHSESKLYASIKEHFETIEPYLDRAVRSKLEENGIELENYFDLLFYIQVNFNEFILGSEKNGRSVEGKNLEILQYVLDENLYYFTMMKFKLNKLASRGTVTKKDVTDAIGRIIRPGAIFGLASEKLVCEVVGYSGDHKYPKITSIIAQQEHSSGGQRDTNKRVVPGPEHWLDLSMVTSGSILNLPKANPTPVVRGNPWITIDERSYTVLPNPKFKEFLESQRPLFKL